MIEQVPMNAGVPLVRTLTVPFPAGMAERFVQAASFDVAGVATYTTRPVTASMQPPGAPGVLDLTDASRVIGLELAAVTPWPPSPMPPLTIRAATLEGGQYTIGPPVLESPGAIVFDPATPRLTFPAIAGRAWKLELPATFQVTAVLLEHLPHDLTVTLSAGGEPEPLWSHPGPLLPQIGAQTIDFRSAAERLLQTGNAPLTFRITSSTSSRLELTWRQMAATCVARPPARTFALRGSPAELRITAPPKPFAASVQVTAKHRGRELNGGSATASDRAPVSGLRADPSRAIAALASFNPPPGRPKGSMLGLAAVRLRLAVTEAAEVALALHANVAGAPGPPLAAPVVRQLAAGFRDWLEIELPVPQAVATGPDVLWVVLRATRGSLVWCGDAPRPSRWSLRMGEAMAFRSFGTAELGRPLSLPVGETPPRRALTSIDGGAAWSAASIVPWMQLFHAVLLPPSVTIGGWTLLRTAPDSPHFAARVALPSLSMPLQSRSALDVTVDEIALSYDPFAS